MRKLVFTTAVASIVATTAGQALADDAPSRGIELGARVGYGIPMGNFAANNAGTSTSLTDVFSSLVPLQIDALFMINPNVRVGGYFAYGFLGIGNQWNGFPTNCQGNGLSCSAHELRFGAQLHYHFAPDKTLDPWLGAGVGYETATFTESANGQSGSVTTSGFEFFNVQGGLDYKAAANFGVGPYAQLSVAKFSDCSFSDAFTQLGSCQVQNTTLHEWLIFGVRADYEIGF